MKKYISLGIMLSLLSGKRYSAKELAAKYETSLKTIYRAIDCLLEAGMPIVSIAGKGGGYEILKEAKVDSSFFTDQELNYFLSFLKSGGERLLSGETRSIDDRLESCLGRFDSSSARLVIDTSIWASSESQSPTAAIVSDAIFSSRVAEIVYAGQSGQTLRQIEPHTLVYKTGEWYVYAYCLFRKSFRLFKLSRIKSIKLLSATFTRKNIDIISKPWNEDYKKNLQKMDICLKYSCEDDLLSFIDNPKIVADGASKVVRGQVYYSMGLLHRLFELSGKVTILWPESLKKAIYGECEKLCAAT